MESSQINKDVSIYPLYIFITALLGYLTVISAVYLFQLGDVFFTGLLLTVCLFHIGLYWINYRIVKNTGWWIFYYITQTLLITAITVITRKIFVINISLFESVIICIVGETLGWWGNSRKSFFIGGFFAVYAIILLSLFSEGVNLISSLNGLLINGGAIMLIMILFNQQMAEREKAIELAESLESANAKLVTYNAKIESLILQNERQRMARELH